MRIRGDKGRLSYFAGWIKTFQGLGFSISFDNPTWEVRKTIEIEILFLYFKAWLIYKRKTKN